MSGDNFLLFYSDKIIVTRLKNIDSGGIANTSGDDPISAAIGCLSIILVLISFSKRVYDLRKIKTRTAGEMLNNRGNAAILYSDITYIQTFKKVFSRRFRISTYHQTFEFKSYKFWKWNKYITTLETVLPGKMTSQ